MTAQLSGFLHALQHHQHQIVMDYFFLSALSWSYWVKIRSTTLGTVLIDALAGLCILAGFVYIFTIALYLLYPNYLDHIQPTVASISWLWMHDHKLYPNLISGEIYGLVYGPVLFLINGMALLLNPSIFASKLPGVLSLGAALGATWLLLTWRTSSLASLFLLAALIMLFATFDEFAYSNRAEPFLILLSVLALLLAVRSSSLVTGVGIGVLAGVATGLKLHGFIYTIPAAAVALARIKTPSDRVLMTIIGSACAVAFALLPYLEKGVSIIGYLRFLTLELDNGLSSSLRSGVLPATLLVENLLFAFILTAPLVGILIWRKPTLNTPDRRLLAALGVSVAMTTVIGATSGGGAYHLLPLAPICIYGIAVVCESSKTETKVVAALIFASFFLGYGPQLYLHMRSLIGLYQVADPSEREKIAELKTYLSSYPEAQIGISDYKHYRDYFYRVFSVWNGRPLDIDFSNWMAMANAGRDEKHIARFIEGCTVPTWILPLGPPFTMFNWYTDLPLLSERFRTTFSTNYRQIATGRAYQVWKCQLESPQSGG
jgi:hypothetical protein